MLLGSPDEITEGEASVSFTMMTFTMTLQQMQVLHTAATGCFCSVQKNLARVYAQNIENQHEYIKDAKTVSQKLSGKASEMQGVTPYRTTQCDEPPVRPRRPSCSASTEPQRKQSIIHALTRADLNGHRPGATVQSVPSYNGFHACLNADEEKGKAYFHMS